MSLPRNCAVCKNNFKVEENKMKKKIIKRGSGYDSPLKGISLALPIPQLDKLTKDAKEQCRSKNSLVIYIIKKYYEIK